MGITTTRGVAEKRVYHTMRLRTVGAGEDGGEDIMFSVIEPVRGMSTRREIYIIQ